MKKFLIFLIILLNLSPYLFLATSVTDVKDSEKEYNCIVEQPIKEKHLIIFGSVFYSYNFKLKNNRIILPYLFFNEMVWKAKCPDNKIITLGTLSDNWIKVNEKVHIYTKQQKLSIFNIFLLQEEDIYMFGTGWTNE